MDDGSLLEDCVRSVLARHAPDDWQVSPGEFWCQVRPAGTSTRVQGWKLHLSATPLSAVLVLARSAEVLARRRCTFKFASTLGRVAELTSRQADRGAGGKFITVYPECGDRELRELAEELDEATRGLPGPGILSDRPYRPGSLVHYRFGVYRGITVLGNEATYEAMLMAPDGSLVLDWRAAWFSPPPWAPEDPFTAQRTAPPAADGTDPERPKPVRLDDRYVVDEVIRHAFTGGVYRATDTRTAAPVIVKQARPHTGNTLAGQDARDTRRHEAAMLELFASSGLTPRPVALFEQQGDLFLVQEAVAGVTLRQWVARHIAPDDGGTWGLSPDTARHLAARLVDLMELVHREGFVIRDFTPNNVMVTEDRELRLIDLELLARPGEQVLRAYTPGYAAPEQVHAPVTGAAPGPAADLHGLGATFFHLLTGADPLLAPDEPPVRPDRQRIEHWLGHVCPGNPAARELAPVVLDLLHEEPARRPGLADIRRALADGPGAAVVLAAAPAGLKQLTDDSLDHLLATMDRDAADWLWAPQPSGTNSGTNDDPFTVQNGAAGILGVLARACRTAPDPALREAVATAADWIVQRCGREPRVLPGLYFGRSGTAWALLDAAEVLADGELADYAAELARRVPVRWPNPDICHGTAGAGMTQLRFWEATGADDFLDRAREAAAAVMSAAVRHDGLVHWQIPRNWPSGLAGLVHHGFAHGIAGIGAFLLAAGRATDDPACHETADAAARTLLAQVELDDGAAYWTSGPSSRVRRTNWCSGSSGVGTFLLRAGQDSDDPQLQEGLQKGLQEAAGQAALAVRRSRWHTATAQCHGLAGDGEFLLDLAQASGQQRYHHWAEELATAIQVRHALRDGRMLAPDETGLSAGPAYGTGLAGVLAFLLRLRDGGPRMWLPRVFTGPDRPGEQHRDRTREGVTWDGA
ncbi:class IV lanthionine synthetase LanL [Streptomyces sp. NPDC001262]|uniref:class IV lanthionine synthetase LanL n=1 Tax=Streptomyces sp. NPDC001262 TaxID=3364552 RepID=UPI00367BAA75